MTKEVELLNSSASSATGLTVAFDTRRAPALIVVVKVDSTGSVTVQGRLDSDTTWIPLRDASTATEGFIVTAMPLMRAVSSGVSGGSVRCTVMEMRQ